MIIVIFSVIDIVIFFCFSVLLRAHVIIITPHCNHNWQSRSERTNKAGDRSQTRDKARNTLANHERVAQKR